MHFQGLSIGIVVLSLVPIHVSGEEGDDALPFNIGIFSKIRGLTDNPLLQSELEISDEQLKKVGEILARVEANDADSMLARRKQRELFPPPPDTASLEERLRWGDAMMEPFRDLKRRQEMEYKSLQEVLLQHQILRIHQIMRQGKLLDSLNKGFEGLLIAPMFLKREVGISEEECKELQPRLEEIEATYAKELAELRAATYQAVLDDLNDEQRNKMEKLVGPPFDFDDSDRVSSRTIREKLKENPRLLQQGLSFPKSAE